MTGIKLLVSDHHGVYIPQVFVENFDLSEWNLAEHDVQILKEGPDADWYWDEWDNAMIVAEHKDADGNVWQLWQDGDLWAYCPALMSDEEYEEFFGEKRED